MAAAVVSIICIALIVIGGMTLSQGILTSSDSAALSVNTISVREGDIMRTNINILRAAELTWGNDLRIIVKNTGQTKLSSYDKWDLIVTYVDTVGSIHTTWLLYTADTVPGNNEWTRAKIGLEGPYEYFEPGILNPGEEMTMLAHLDPKPGAANGSVSLTTPNGVFRSVLLVNPGYLRLTLQSEKTNLGGNKYFQAAEGSTADGSSLTAATQFNNGETGKKLLYDAQDATRPACFVYPLTGITEIPSANWTVTYRCKIADGGVFPQTDTDSGLNINILIRQADGTIRTTLNSNAAQVYFSQSEAGNWVTLTGTLLFPGYTVVDDDDYLEIDIYGQSDSGPNGSTGTIQVLLDEFTLPVGDQTKIETLQE